MQYQYLIVSIFIRLIILLFFIKWTTCTESKPRTQIPPPKRTNSLTYTTPKIRKLSTGVISSYPSLLSVYKSSSLSLIGTYLLPSPSPIISTLQIKFLSSGKKVLLLLVRLYHRHYGHK